MFDSLSLSECETGHHGKTNEGGFPYSDGHQSLSYNGSERFRILLMVGRSHSPPFLVLKPSASNVFAMSVAFMPDSWSFRILFNVSISPV
jgi:hypothetical protein